MQLSAPIFGFNDARDDIVSTVVERVVSGTKDSLLALNDAAYHETKRLEGARKPGDDEGARGVAEARALARAHGRR
jgi:glycerol-3-phosphate O-acyltransferase